MRGAHVAGNFARRVFCKRLKFPQNSPPCRVPCQFHRTLSHSHIFTVDRLQLSLEISSATTFRGTDCRWAQTILSRAISFLATALSAISSCYLLSLAIWRYLPPPGSPSSPCLSPVYNCLQTEIVLTPPVTFKALPSAHTTTLCQEKTFWLENT